MFKKIIGLLLMILLFGLVLPARALEECGGKTGNDAANCWTRREGELKQLITQSQGEQKTLADTITFLNNKIALTQAQIYQTEEELKTLESEITTLSVKIVRLNDNLGDVSRLLVSRIGEAYKRISIKPLYLFLSSNGFNDFFTRNKYLKSAQQNDRKILLELQNSKDTHQEQKDEKEEKQKEKEEVQNRLAIQKSANSAQKKEKQNLLTITQNDEKKYQNFLIEARNQKTAFSSYIASQGGASILNNQTKCDGWGCYYNQRDSSWGNSIIGFSGDSSMREYGCLVTSMAMIASHYSKNLNPGSIANSSNPFFGSTAYMLLGSWSVNGVTTTRTRLGSSLSNIDSELNAGRPVIVGIYGGPDHFLVIKGKENGEYIMHDPFPENGANIKFTDKYPLSAITQVDRVTM